MSVLRARLRLKRSLRQYCCRRHYAYAGFNIFYQHIVHIDWDVVYNHASPSSDFAMFIFIPILSNVA